MKHDPKLDAHGACCAIPKGSSGAVPQALREGYFKPEPRDTVYWLSQINSWCRQQSNRNLLLPDIDIELLAQYIQDPAATLASGLLNESQKQQLQAPQHILLFYFLRKIAAFETVNDKLTSDFKNSIAKLVFGYSPKLAIPQQGIAYINAEQVNKKVKIAAGAKLKAYSKGKEKPLYFESQQSLSCFPVKLEKLLSVQPDKAQPLSKTVCEHPLPLAKQNHIVRPFKPTPKKHPHLSKFLPGVAFTSSLLFLAQGHRTITVTLRLPDGIENCQDILFQVSTSSGWREVEATVAREAPLSQCSKQEENKNKVVLNIHVPPSFPAITTIANPPARFQFAAQQPALLLTAKNEPPKKEQQLKKELPKFGNYGLQSIAVKVAGLRPSAVRNQEGLLAPEDSLELFGSTAPADACFSFAHPELACKPLQSISFTPVWTGKPGNLTDYYKAYKKSEGDFCVTSRMMCLDNPSALSADDKQNANGKEALCLFNQTLAYRLPKYDFSSITAWQAEQPDPLKQPLYFQWQLGKQDFGVQEYPLLMTNYAIAKAQVEKNAGNNDEKQIVSEEPAPNDALLISETAGDSDEHQVVCEEPVPVNTPWIPKAAAINISYRGVIEVGQKTDLIQRYQIAPLGYCKEEHKLTPTDPRELLLEPCQSAVYFGFTQLQRDRESSLYFKGLPGDSGLPKYPVDWQYLANTGWQSLSSRILFDDTDGLCQAGLMRWSTPEDIASDNSLMPTGCYWLRIVPGSKDKKEPTSETLDWRAIMTIQELKTNGIYIVRDPADLQTPEQQYNLENGAKLKLEKPSLQLQDFDTLQEGHPEENEQQFWTRVFNNVRYRSRPTTVHDYEHLILESFSSVRQVMCLDAGMNVVELGLSSHPSQQTTERNNGGQRTMVSAVIVEKVDAVHQPFPAKPKVSRRLLKRINQRVTGQCSAFVGHGNGFHVGFQAINPVYRDIGFKLVVKLSHDIPPRQYRQRIYQALRNYVNPWVNSKEAFLKFGCWFSFGDIASRLQNLSDVEVLLALKLNIADGAKLCPPSRYAFAPYEVPIFKEGLSTIEVVNDLDNYTANQYYGIDSMQVDTDFYVQ